MCIQWAFGFVTPISISNLLILLDVDVYKEHTENLVAGFQKQTKPHAHTHTCTIVGAQEMAQSVSSCHTSVKT